MKTSFAAGSLLAALAFVGPLHGQQVAAAVGFRSGPVAALVRIGDGYSTYHGPAVVYRRAPEPERLIVVERLVRRHRHSASDWQREGYRRATVYYMDGRYYDRWVRGRPGMREVVVLERDGRFYQACDDDGRDRDRGDESHREYDGRDRHWKD